MHKINLSEDIKNKIIDMYENYDVTLEDIAKEVNVSELNIGDEVYIRTYKGYEKHKVVGFGADEFINGYNVKGKPYVDLYKKPAGEVDYSWNINNYIKTDTIRKVVEEEETNSFVF